MNYQLLLLSFLYVIAVLGIFDIVIYILKSIPKISHFSKYFHRLAYLSTMFIIYYYLNGNKFW